MAEQPKFESVNGVYRITEEQKPQLKEFFINEMEKNPKTAKGWLSKSKVNTKTIITDSKGNDLYEAFFKGNQDKWKFNKLETQIKAANKRKVNEEALDKTTTKTWKKKNITDWNAKDNPTGKPITDSHPEFRRFEHKIKVSDYFWKTDDALDLGFKAGDVENLTYTNPAQWKLKDAGEMKYGKYFNFDIDDFGEVTYTPRSKFHPFEFNDTKTFTGQISFDELAEEASLAYEKYGKPKTKNIVRNSLIASSASNVAASVLNPASAQAWGDINRDGFNKDRVERFAKGIGEDLIWGNVFSTTLKGGGKAITPILKPVLSALPGAVNGFATTVAAPVVTGGLLLAGAKGVLDGYVTGLTGSDSNEIGRRAEEDKQQLLKENGGNGTSLRKYYRNGNSTANEKLAKHRHLNGLEDT